jgi:hypothetical protein
MTRQTTRTSNRHGEKGAALVISILIATDESGADQDQRRDDHGPRDHTRSMSVGASLQQPTQQ